MLAKHCANHFTMYIYVKSLCCTPEISALLYVGYIWRKVGKKSHGSSKKARFVLPRAWAVDVMVGAPKTIL